MTDTLSYGLFNASICLVAIIATAIFLYVREKRSNKH